jgi:prolyl 4-hydroxylase
MSRTSAQRAAPDAEFQALARKTYAGKPQALAALGARLVVGRDAPRSPVDGAALISEAAQQGDAAAWHYHALLAATGVGREQSWEDAFAALSRAAELGHDRAAAGLALLRGAGIGTTSELLAWLAAPPFRTVHASPRMVAYPGFLTPALCAHLRACAMPNLERAQVHDVRQNALKIDPMRSNTGAAFSLIDTDIVIQAVRARIARAAEVELATLEPPEVLHYSIGEQYRLHIDFHHPSIPHFAEQLRERGQRIKTFLVYLNDDFEGGHTEFPKLGVKFRGALGEALMFDNVGPDGEGDMRTQHAGLPPTHGEKWLFSQWIRSKPQPVA